MLSFRNFSLIKIYSVLEDAENKLSINKVSNINFTLKDTFENILKIHQNKKSIQKSPSAQLKQSASPLYPFLFISIQTRMGFNYS